MIVYGNNGTSFYYLVKNNETEEQIAENIKQELYSDKFLSYLKENIDGQLYKLTFYDSGDRSFKSEVLVVDNYC